MSAVTVGGPLTQQVERQRRENRKNELRIKYERANSEFRQFDAQLSALEQRRKQLKQERDRLAADNPSDLGELDKFSRRLDTVQSRLNALIDTMERGARSVADAERAAGLKAEEVPQALASIEDRRRQLCDERERVASVELAVLQHEGTKVEVEKLQGELSDLQGSVQKARQVVEGARAAAAPRIQEIDSILASAPEPSVEHERLRLQEAAARREFEACP